MQQERDLFICHTAYQVFISCLRGMRAAQKPDIVLASGVLPGAQALAERLAASGIFGQVLTFDEQAAHSPLAHGPAQLVQHLRHRRYIEKNCGFRLDFAQYRMVYIYNDWSDLGRYLQDCRAPYTLCEDAFAGHNRPDHVWADGQAKQPLYALRQRLGWGYLYWGQARCCTAIEAERLPCPPCMAEKCVVDSKEALFASVKPEEKQKLLAIFVTQSFPLRAEKPFLLLTRSFVADGFLPDAAAAVTLYRDVLAEYAQGCTVFIKAHPRDLTDYAAAFPQAIVLDKNMPSEVLNVAFPFRFCRAVTVGSSALNTLRCADEKIMLPEEETERYQNR